MSIIFATPNAVMWRLACPLNTGRKLLAEPFDPNIFIPLKNLALPYNKPRASFYFSVGRSASDVQNNVSTLYRGILSPSHSSAFWVYHRVKHSRPRDTQSPRNWNLF